MLKLGGVKNQENLRATQAKFLKLEECLKMEINEKVNIENELRKVKHELHSLNEDYKVLKIVLSCEEKENAKIKNELKEAKANTSNSQSNLKIENQRLAQEVNELKGIKKNLKWNLHEEKRSLKNF